MRTGLFYLVMIMMMYFNLERADTRLAQKRAEEHQGLKKSMLHPNMRSVCFAVVQYSPAIKHDGKYADNAQVM